MKDEFLKCHFLLPPKVISLVKTNNKWPDSIKIVFQLAEKKQLEMSVPKARSTEIYQGQCEVLHNSNDKKLMKMIEQDIIFVTHVMMMMMKKKIMKATILSLTYIIFTFISLHSSSFVITHRKIPTFWMRRICLRIHIITVRYLIFTANINKIIILTY